MFAVRVLSGGAGVPRVTVSADSSVLLNFAGIAE
jgi:hypothetical protein